VRVEEGRGTYREERYTQRGEVHTEGRGTHRGERYIQRGEVHTEGRGTYRRERYIQRGEVHTEGRGTYRVAVGKSERMRLLGESRRRWEDIK
jgi:hypothetical protein